MAFGKKKKESAKIIIPESGELHTAVQGENNEKVKKEKQGFFNDTLSNGEKTNGEEVKTTIKEDNKPKSIRKGSKVIANGRCFGSSNLECPLKTVRNYETKILDISDKSVLIDEGWISKDSIK